MYVSISREISGPRAAQFSIFHVGILPRALIRPCNDAITKNLPITTCLPGAYRSDVL